MKEDRWLLPAIIPEHRIPLRTLICSICRLVENLELPQHRQAIGRHISKADAARLAHVAELLHEFITEANEPRTTRVRS